MRINVAQRNMLLAASAVLALLWLMQVGSDGLAESHWIVIVPLIAAILFFAFSSRVEKSSEHWPADPPSPASPITAKSIAANRGKVDEGDLVVQTRYDECARQWGTFIRSALVDRMPKASALDRAAMMPFLTTAAAKMAFANYSLVILHRSPEAYKSEDLKALRLHALTKVAQCVKETLEQVSGILSGMPPIEFQDCLTMAQKQIMEYEQALVRVRKSFAAQSAFPLDPILVKLDEDAKFSVSTPADRESFYGIKYREETGRLIHPTPGVAR